MIACGEDCLFLEGDSSYDLADSGTLESCTNFSELGSSCMCLWSCDQILSLGVSELCSRLGDVL